MRRSVIIIFCRAPRFGAVKSRLARGIGPAQALRFYRATLRATIRTAQRLGTCETVLCVTPDSTVRARDWPPGTLLIPQGAGDLGQRMARALDGFHDRDRILIGGDIPDIRPRHLRQALKQVRGNAVTFGPATDGGFWLVGLRRGARAPGLFSDVRWSCSETLADSVATLPDAWRVGMASALNDVDDLGDYRRQMNRH